MLKDSSLVSTVSVLDLMRQGQIVAAEKFVYFESLIFIGVIYYVLVMGLAWVGKTLEVRLRQSD